MTKAVDPINHLANEIARALDRGGLLKDASLETCVLAVDVIDERLRANESDADPVRLPDKCEVCGSGSEVGRWDLDGCNMSVCATCHNSGAFRTFLAAEIEKALVEDPGWRKNADGTWGPLDPVIAQLDAMADMHITQDLINHPPFGSRETE